MSYAVLVATPNLGGSSGSSGDTSLGFDTKLIDLKHHKLIFAAQFGAGSHSFSVELKRPKTTSQPLYQRITNPMHVSGIYCGKTSLPEHEIVEYFNKYPGWNKLYFPFTNDCQTLVIYMLAWLGLQMESNHSEIEVKPDSNTDQQVCRELVTNIRGALQGYSRQLPWIKLR